MLPFGLLLCFLYPSTAVPIVTTPLGTVNGFTYVTKSGVPTDIFLGIPFAQPPMGNLRFEKPLDPLPFGNLNATKFGNVCIPHTRQAIIANVTTSEDCLTLNIFRPQNAGAGPLPVLVWVHGGGYEIGSASQFGYSGFADNYIPQGILVVTLQYRLGVHGYLSVGIPELNGNFGAFDQAKAIEFINKYIGLFGGDNSKVTVWGLSAGGCSVAHLVLSPYTRDMVSGGIEMSGSAFSSWGVGTAVTENSWELLAVLGCLGSQIKQCLKGKTIDQIYDAVERVGYTTNGLDNIKWGPTIDGDFLPTSPFALARQGRPKPMMVGVGNKDAGYFSLLGYSPYIQNLSIPVSQQANFNQNTLISTMRRLIRPQFFGNNTEQALQLMINKYAPPGRDAGFYLDQFNTWANEMYFFVPAVDGLISRRDSGWQMYAYRFDQFNPVIWQNKQMPYQQAWGSVHTNEYAYMFDLFNMGNYSMTGDDGAVHSQLVSAIASFTQTGVPRPNGMTWPTVGDNLNYYIFKGQPEVQQNYFQTEYNFMTQLRNLGFDLSFLQPTSYTTKSNTNRTLAIIGNSWAANTSPLIFEECGKYFENIQRTTYAGCEIFRTNDAPHCRGPEQAYLDSVKQWNPDYLFIITRYCYMGLRYNDAQWNMIVNLADQKLALLASYVKKKIFIVDTFPYAILYKDNLNNALDKIALVNWQNGIASTDLPKAQQKLAEIVSKCDKCEQFDITPPFMTNGQFLPYDAEYIIPYVNTAMHFTEAGLETMRPVFRDIYNRIGKQ